MAVTGTNTTVADTGRAAKWKGKRTTGSGTGIRPGRLTARKSRPQRVYALRPHLFWPTIAARAGLSTVQNSLTTPQGPLRAIWRVSDRRLNAAPHARASRWCGSRVLASSTNDATGISERASGG